MVLFAGAGEMLGEFPAIKLADARELAFTPITRSGW